MSSPTAKITLSCSTRQGVCLGHSEYTPQVVTPTLGRGHTALPNRSAACYTAPRKPANTVPLAYSGYGDMSAVPAPGRAAAAKAKAKEGFMSFASSWDDEEADEGFQDEPVVYLS